MLPHKKDDRWEEFNDITPYQRAEQGKNKIKQVVWLNAPYYMLHCSQFKERSESGDKTVGVNPHTTASLGMCQCLAVIQIRTVVVCWLLELLQYTAEWCSRTDPTGLWVQFNTRIFSPGGFEMKSSIAKTNKSLCKSLHKNSLCSVAFKAQFHYSAITVENLVKPWFDAYRPQ